MFATMPLHFDNEIATMLTRRRTFCAPDQGGRVSITDALAYKEYSFWGQEAKNTKWYIQLQMSRFHSFTQTL
jgi:hypothetical protein